MEDQIADERSLKSDSIVSYNVVLPPEEQFTPLNIEFKSVHPKKKNTS